MEIMLRSREQNRSLPGWQATRCLIAPCMHLKHYYNISPHIKGRYNLGLVRNYTHTPTHMPNAILLGGGTPDAKVGAWAGIADR